MPTSARARAAASNTGAATDSAATLDATSAATTLTLADKADALYRASVECCRQHERAAHLVGRSASEAEQKAAHAMVDLCDGLLADLTAAYERRAARLHPDGADEAWWHRANALWHASREYARRHRGADRADRARGSEQHPSALFSTLNMEYELEASALLALKHAADAYRKVRPDAG